MACINSYPGPASPGRGGARRDAVKFGVYSTETDEGPETQCLVDKQTTHKELCDSSQMTHGLQRKAEKVSTLEG